MRRLDLQLSIPVTSPYDDCSMITSPLLLHHAEHMHHIEGCFDVMPGTDFLIGYTDALPPVGTCVRSDV